MREPTGVAAGESTEATVNEPTSVTVNKPSNITVDKPTDASIHKPTGVTAEKSTDAAIHKPADATKPGVTVAEPIKTTVDNPTEATADNPTKVAAPAENAEPTLSLLGHAPMTYESALDTDMNCVSEAAFFRATTQLYETLWAQRPAMRGLVRHHLGLQDRDDVVCDIAPPQRWLLGGFNVCIPVRVRSVARSYRLMLRCALPHKLAEPRYPGTVNEKTACEVAAYVWMQERCRDIPIPRLYGFGFSDHRRFTHEDYRPWYIRIAHRLRRLLRGFLGSLHEFFYARPVGPGPPMLTSRYTYHPNVTAAHRLPSAYILLEDVNATDSQVLDKTWTARRKDPVRQQNLFRGLARIMLSLARVPLPHIGAFRFRDDGTIALTNRPLDCTMTIFENDGTPRVMPGDRTYSAVEPYVADIFRLHNQRFLTHPNAIYDECDCRSEMAAWVLVRSLAHRYVRPEQRNGPFLLQLNDLRPRNIFVDDAWNVTCIVDLEWVCALPVERLDVPYWLTGQDIGGLEGEALAEYIKVRDAFMVVFEEEESRIAAEHGLSLTKMLHESWTSGGAWFWHGLTSINAMRILFEQHLRPRFFPRDLLSSEETLVSMFWSEGANDVVQSKVNAYEQYARDLKDLFNSV